MRRVQNPDTERHMCVFYYEHRPGSKERCSRCIKHIPSTLQIYYRFKNINYNHRLMQGSWVEVKKMAAVTADLYRETHMNTFTPKTLCFDEVFFNVWWTFSKYFYNTYINLKSAVCVFEKWPRRGMACYFNAPMLDRILKSEKNFYEQISYTFTG